MSIVASWDIQSHYSPRAVTPCEDLIARSSSSNAGPGSLSSLSHNNPFDDATDRNKNTSNTLAIVYGTEKGSLHSRVYNAPPSSGSGSGGGTLSSPQRGRTSNQSFSTPQLPLNVRANRSNLPTDLTTIVNGSIVALIACQPHAWLVLVDDHKGALPGAFAAYLLTLPPNNNSQWQWTSLQTRMSAAAYHPVTGLVYAAGKSVSNSIPSQNNVNLDVKRLFPSSSNLYFAPHILPSPGARSGPDGLILIANGHVAVVAVGHAFYAVASSTKTKASANSVPDKSRQQDRLQQTSTGAESPIKLLLSLQQSSQVHPVIALQVKEPTLEIDWSCCFLASGRECAVVDVYYAAPRLSASKPRHGTVTLASPLLNAVVSLPWLVLLTSDGLVSVRSPSCLAIPLRTVEVGTRPNDFFRLTVLNSNAMFPYLLALAYSGEAKILQCQPDSAQDLADRLMRHAIDAFGSNGFPRAQVAEALQASFTATSYVGPEASQTSKALLQHYLEAILGLTDWESGAVAGWPTEYRQHYNQQQHSISTVKAAIAVSTEHHGAWGQNPNRLYTTAPAAAISSPVITDDTPAALLTATSLLCLVCSQISPINAALIKRAAKACASSMGVVIVTDNVNTSPSPAATEVCVQVADRLLKEALSGFTLISGSSPNPIARRPNAQTLQNDVCEAAVWLLRACGQHEQALQVASERLQGRWSNIKYESYIATHLSDVFTASGAGQDLVLKSPSLVRLLENNPRLGLSVLTSLHPQNETQWLECTIDPLLADDQRSGTTIKLLKSIKPIVPYDKSISSPVEDTVDGNNQQLPLETGRALAIAFIESALGISSGRPIDEGSDTGNNGGNNPTSDTSAADTIANFHDEYAYLLLEGVISERRDDVQEDIDSDLGLLYRLKLRRFLKWPLAKLRASLFMDALPTSFLQEKALVYGRLGRHQDAIKILYHDLKSLELALEYCDDRHERQNAQLERRRALQMGSTYSEYDDFRQPEEDNAYLPLMQVALDSDAESGAKVAIQVLSLRRSAIDRAAALRLLPADIPVSAVARPFLIPALVDSESQVRRLTVVSSLLRARYLRLQDRLTLAQLEAQANLHVVPQLRSLDLGDPLHSTEPFRAKSSASASSSMPEVNIIKHFFPRYLVIQAQITNHPRQSDKQVRTLTDIAFVVAESSEDAIQPLLQVPVQVLPPNMTGSAWCVLQAAPARMESAVAALTCELRYTVQIIDNIVQSSTSYFTMMHHQAPAGAVVGRTFVEELQDLEVQASFFRT